MIPPSAIRAAAERLAGIARRTPLRRSEALSAQLGGDVWLKLENQQLTGSFKLRGAFNTLATLSAEERARGVVASSAGNHGLGLAWAARHFGTAATIFVPRTAPAVKREGIASLGARVNAEQPDYDAAHAAALDFARAQGAVFVNPCAGHALLAGQGTVGLEIVEELPSLAMLLVSVGGGGLLGGVGSLLRAEHPDVRIVGAQSELTDAMARAMAAGHVTEVDVVPTLADGLAGQVDEEGLAIARETLDAIVTVDEDTIALAIAWLARHEGLIVEGSGAVPVAALLAGAVASPRFPLVAIVSGGNIDRERHAALMAGMGRP